MSRIEKQSIQLGCSFFYSSLTDIIWITIFASCYLQKIKNLWLTRPLSGKVYNIKLFKAFSNAQVWLIVICGPLLRFAASNLLCLLKSKKSKYFVVSAYIILIFAVILYASKSETCFTFTLLYIQLSQQYSQSILSSNAIFHIKHARTI